MRANLGRACLAGFIASTITAFMVFFISPNMTGGPADLAAVAAGMAGLNVIGAAALFYLVGAFVLPLTYIRLVDRWLAGGALLRGMTWGIMLWLLSQGFIAPATDGGFFSLGSGGLVVALESLAGHIAHGLAFGVWLGDAEGRPAKDRVGFDPRRPLRRAG